MSQIPDNTKDAICREWAQGLEPRYIAAMHGLSVEQVRRVASESWLETTERYRATLMCKAAMNLTKIQLAGDLILDNLIAEATDRGAKGWLEASKQLLPHILPIKSDQHVTVEHRMTADVAVQLIDAITTLKQVNDATPDLLPIEHDPHITQGTDGLPVYAVSGETTHERRTNGGVVGSLSLTGTTDPYYDPTPDPLDD